MAVTPSKSRLVDGDKADPWEFTSWKAGIVHFCERCGLKESSWSDRR